MPSPAEPPVERGDDRDGALANAVLAGLSDHLIREALTEADEWADTYRALNERDGLGPGDHGHYEWAKGFSYGLVTRQPTAARISAPPGLGPAIQRELEGETYAGAEKMHSEYRAVVEERLESLRSQEAPPSLAVLPLLMEDDLIGLGLAAEDQALLEWVAAERPALYRRVRQEAIRRGEQQRLVRHIRRRARKGRQHRRVAQSESRCAVESARSRDRQSHNPGGTSSHQGPRRTTGSGSSSSGEDPGGGDADGESDCGDVGADHRRDHLHVEQLLAGRGRDD